MTRFRDGITEGTKKNVKSLLCVPRDQWGFNVGINIHCHKLTTFQPNINVYFGAIAYSQDVGANYRRDVNRILVDIDVNISEQQQYVSLWKLEGWVEFGPQQRKKIMNCKQKSIARQGVKRNHTTNEEVHAQFAIVEAPSAAKVPDSPLVAPTVAPHTAPSTQARKPVAAFSTNYRL
ncbi:Uncharacterized protein TCM_014363 [Theobroma cacao]|uniref:Uncharacterized protein n=1 Tax=Theobroma cacao TaxID=3641 RepID=A0A061FYP4_THECC|nr:Uncharacterized protein TCM_014363 [Theobroma cacao]